MKNFYDNFILIVSTLLLVFGIIVVSITTYNLDLSFKYMFNQNLATFIGIISFFIIMKIPSKIFKKMAFLIYAFSILLLIWVLIDGTGLSEWGAKSWIRFSYFGFQPAEIVKIGFILSFSSFLSVFHKRINEPKIFIFSIIILLLPILLIMKQPDFGTSLVYIFIFTIMLLSSKLNKRYISLGLILFSILAPIVWFNLKEYQKNRIYNFLNPSFDLNNSGFQVFLSKKAISSSGFFGKRFLSKNTFIDVPEKHTDFVFTAITENFGILGGFIIVFIFLLLIFRISLNAYRQNDFFKKFALFGFSAMIFCHFFENIGMTMGALPMTGIPLPFMSYGGTFQLTNILAISFCYKFSKLS